MQGRRAQIHRRRAERGHEPADDAVIVVFIVVAFIIVECAFIIVERAVAVAARQARRRSAGGAPLHLTMIFPRSS